MQGVFLYRLTTTFSKITNLIVAVTVSVRVMSASRDAPLIPKHVYTHYLHAHLPPPISLRLTMRLQQSKRTIPRSLLYSDFMLNSLV
jgi:hypothetical protein